MATKQQVAQQPQKRHFSPETRRKLSEAAKRRWAAWAVREQQEAKAAKEHSLADLYLAAEKLVPDDQLKAAICGCAKGTTIIHALEYEMAEGTSLQDRLRKALVELILAHL